MDLETIEKEINELKECQYRQIARQEELDHSQQEILNLLRPIADTYRTATTLGKWAMGGLVFISVVIGLLVGLKNLK